MTALSSIPGLDAALNAIKQGSTSGATNEDGTIKGTFKDLPYDREFHATVESAEFKPANSGAPGIRYVLQITDPEFEGSKVWDSVYFTGHEFQGQRLAVLLGAAGGTANTIEEAVPAIVGGKVVIALQENDQNPQYPQTRWVSIDVGQKLKTNIKPKPGKGTPVGLQAAPNIVEQVKAQQAAQTAPAAVQAPLSVTPSLPGVPPVVPSGIRLPGNFPTTTTT